MVVRSYQITDYKNIIVQNTSCFANAIDAVDSRVLGRPSRVIVSWDDCSCIR